MTSSWFSLDWRPGARALRRDWRSGELRLLWLALVVAVTAVTSVGFLADRVQRTLQRDAAQMLGGDIVLRADAPLAADVAEYARSLGMVIAQTIQMPSMVGVPAGGMQLASLKAVEPAYPLRGQLRLTDGRRVSAPAPGEAWADGLLLARLGVQVGDTVQVGRQALRVAGTIDHEPDRGVQFVNTAPRLMIAMDDLAASELLAPGSRAQYRLLATGDELAVATFHRWLQGRLEAGQHLETTEEHRPQAHRHLVRAQQFLSLVALLTVLIAAMAVGLASRRHVQRQRQGMAVVRCLGISRPAMVHWLLVEFLLLALLASVVGTALGWGLHQVLAALVAPWFEAGLPPPGWGPVWQGLACGVGLLVGLALPPLAALARVPPVRVLRDVGAPLPVSARVSTLVAVLALGGLVIWLAGDVQIGLVALGGFLAVFLAGLLAGHALLAVLSLVRRHVRLSPAWRFALAGMQQRRGLTLAQLSALSLGGMVLLLLGILRNDLMADWQAALPSDAPNGFLLNIQPAEQAAVAQALADAGVADPVLWPMVRGRLVAINGRAVQADDYADGRARRMVNREFNLSHATQMPDSNTLVAGRWLDAAAHEVALETGLAQTLGVGLGDELGFDVAGQPVNVRIVGLRDVKWDSFEANFFALLSPAALQDAPGTYLTAFHLPASGQDTLLTLLRHYPHLTHIDVGHMLAQLRGVLGQVAQAVQWLFALALVAGLVVLGAALHATRDERRRDTAVLRALGASADLLRRSLSRELLLVGLLAGLLSAAGATAIAWVLAAQVFEFTFRLPVWPWVAGMVGGMLVTSLAGRWALAGVLRASPLSTLRTAH